MIECIGGGPWDGQHVDGLHGDQLRVFVRRAPEGKSVGSLMAAQRNLVHVYRLNRALAGFTWEYQGQEWE